MMMTTSKTKEERFLKGSVEYIRADGIACPACRDIATSSHLPEIRNEDGVRETWHCTNAFCDCEWEEQWDDEGHEMLYIVIKQR